jgi:hypothetical protein
MNTGFRKRDRVVLQRLAAGGDVSSSVMTERMRTACSTGWLPAGLVECQSIGLRRRIYRARPARIDDLKVVLERTFPGYAEPVPEKMSRAQAAQVQGNSKLAPLKDGLVILRDVAGVFGGQSASGDLRAFWVSMLEGAEVRAGIRVLTVENEDSFQVVAPGRGGLPEFDIAVLTHGYPAARTVRWLASIPNIDLVHYGDFDWEGMRIYQTIKAQLSTGSCGLHVPVGLEAAFQRQCAFGKGAMRNAQRRPRPQYAEVSRVLELIDRYGGVGVEQQVFDTVDV